MGKRTVECSHCGTPFQPDERNREFCCSGCEFVSRLIRDGGLDRFYDLKNTKLTPAGGRVFQNRDYNWLLDKMAKAEASSGETVCSLDVGVNGISCVGCVWLIEKLFEEFPGAVEARVQSGRGKALLRWERGRCALDEFAQKLQRFGYLLTESTDSTKREKSVLGRKLGVCAAFALNGMIFSLPGYFGLGASDPLAKIFVAVSFVFATLSVSVGGSYFFWRTFQSLRRGVIHIDLPISFGLICAYAGSVMAWAFGESGLLYFDFVTTFTFLMLLGRWLQERTVESNRNKISKMKIRPEAVILISENGERTLPAEDLEEGKTYRVKPGNLVPVASVLLSKDALISLEWISGESEAKHLSSAFQIPSGAVNLGSEAILLESRESWGASLFANLLREEEGSRENRNLTMERVIRWYLGIVFLIAVTGGIFWWSWGREWITALKVMLSVLVVSCPCALGVALPMCDELAGARLSEMGLFVRRSSLWHRLARIKKIILDKTGTITFGTLKLANAKAIESLTHDQMETLLYMTERNLHPVSRSLREALLTLGVEVSSSRISEKLREVIGYGVEMEDAEGCWRLGKPGWAEGEGGAVRMTETGCVFSLNSRVISTFTFTEEIREGAASEIRSLKKKGYEIFLLSGDTIPKVMEMGKYLDVPEENCLGSFSPDAKARWVQEKDERDTMIVGDGANDSLAFDKAFCSGTPAVDVGLLDRKADFYFLGRDFSGIRCLLEVASNRRKAIRRVLLFSIAYNLLAVSFGLCNLITPFLAAILMPCSSIVSLLLVIPPGTKRAKSL